MAEKKQKERLFCDVEIRVGNRSFSAHRGTLASRSDYFKTMFTINMKEKYSGVVKLRNISPETFELVLDYMYSGEIELTEENVKEVLKAASLFLLADLLDIVDEYLSSILEAKNAFGLKSTSRLYSLPKLQAKVDEYVLDNFNLFSAQESFLDVSVDEIRSYLSSNEIKASEDELVLSLLKWTKADLPNRGESLLSLFSLIRLQHVTRNCLLNTLRKEPLLKDKEFQDNIVDTMHYHLLPFGMKQQERRASSKLVQQDDICCLCLDKTIQKVILGEELSCSTVALSKVSNSEDFHSSNYRDAAVVMHRGRLILFGGATYRSNRFGSSEVERSSIYSFDGQTWKQEGNLIFARKHATVASLEDGVLVFGGVSNQTPMHETEWYSNGTCRTDPQRRTTGRICSQCVVVGGEKVFVIGGFTDVAHEMVQKDVDIFCLNGQKQKGPYLNRGRGNFGACLSSTTIYVCGGKSGTRFVNSIECLVTDPIATSWTIVTSGESINFGCASVVMVDSNQMLVGGESTQLYCFDCKMKCWKDYISLKEAAGTSETKSRLCKLRSVSDYGTFYYSSGSKLFKWEK